MPVTVLQEFRRFRQETLALLGALADQSWQRVGRHPKRGDFAIAARVPRYLGHDENHLNQIRFLRERFGAA